MGDPAAAVQRLPDLERRLRDTHKAAQAARGQSAAALLPPPQSALFRPPAEYVPLQQSREARQGTQLYVLQKPPLPPRRRVTLSLRSKELLKISRNTKKSRKEALEVEA